MPLSRNYVPWNYNDGAIIRYKQFLKTLHRMANSALPSLLVALSRAQKVKDRLASLKQ